MLCNTTLKTPTTTAFDTASCRVSKWAMSTRSLLPHSHPHTRFSNVWISFHFVSSWFSGLRYIIHKLFAAAIDEIVLVKYWIFPSEFSSCREKYRGRHNAVMNWTKWYEQSKMKEKTEWKWMWKEENTDNNKMYVVNDMQIFVWLIFYKCMRTRARVVLFFLYLSDCCATQRFATVQGPLAFIFF